MAKQQNKEPYLLRRQRIVFWVLMVAGVAYVAYHWTDPRRTERIVAEKPEYAVGQITGHFERSRGGGRYGDVDMALFALPDEEKAIVITLDEEGNIVYRECDSLKINEMLTQKEGKYVEKISDEVFDKKVKKGYVLLDFGARWCGPCRLLEPRLENLARQHRKTVSFFKIDIDESPVTANRFGVKVVPTVVLLKDGVEVNRFEGGGLSESEIGKWIEENAR